MPRPWIHSAVPALLVAVLAGAAPARAAGFDLVVNSVADDDDGACTAGPAGCTLREAIAAVNAGVERSIGFDPAVFSPAALTPIQVATPFPVIARSGASVDGTGAAVRIEGGAVAGDGLVFASSTGVALSGVRVRNLIVEGFPGVEVVVCAGGLPACAAPLSDVLVENVAARGGADGVRILGSTASGVAVRNAVASGNTETGIVIGSAAGDAAKVSIVGCTADTTGIAVSASGDLVAPVLSDNVVADSAGIGILVSAGGPRRRRASPATG